MIEGPNQSCADNKIDSFSKKIDMPLIEFSGFCRFKPDCAKKIVLPFHDAFEVRISDLFAFSDFFGQLALELIRIQIRVDFKSISNRDPDLILNRFSVTDLVFR